MAKIVILEGHILNPGDLIWPDLSELTDCTIYDHTPADLLIERCSEAEILISSKAAFTRQILMQLPQLKYIGVTSTGYNLIDIDAAKERNIIVTNIPDYSTNAVAQHTFALLLELTNHICYYRNTVKPDHESSPSDFSSWKKPPIELAGFKLGIMGFGAIGRRVADIGASFGMSILAHSRHRPNHLPASIPWVDKETLLQESDVISLHCPLTAETRHLINAKTLGLMKPSAILINTARGGLIDEMALAKALRNNKIYAAGLDVLEKEPATIDCPLLDLPNCLITPHIAWASKRARQDLLNITIANVKAYLDGSPQNVVT